MKFASIPTIQPTVTSPDRRADLLKEILENCSQYPAVTNQVQQHRADALGRLRAFDMFGGFIFRHRMLALEEKNSEVPV